MQLHRETEDIVFKLIFFRSDLALGLTAPPLKAYAAIGLEVAFQEPDETLEGPDQYSETALVSLCDK